MVMNDGQWALPMLKGIVTPEKINVDFINEILTQLGEEGIEVQEDLDPSLMSNMLRIALNNIVKDLDQDGSQAGQNVVGSTLPSANKSSKLGSKSAKSKATGSSMEEILQNQADGLAEEIDYVKAMNTFPCNATTINNNIIGSVKPSKIIQTVFRTGKDKS